MGLGQLHYQGGRGVPRDNVQARASPRLKIVKTVKNIFFKTVLVSNRGNNEDLQDNECSQKNDSMISLTEHFTHLLVSIEGTNDLCFFSTFFD